MDTKESRGNCEAAEAEAGHERTLELVTSTAVFGAGPPRRQDWCSPAPLQTGSQGACDDGRSSTPSFHGPQPYRVRPDLGISAPIWRPPQPIVVRSDRREYLPGSHRAPPQQSPPPPGGPSVP